MLPRVSRRSCLPPPAPAHRPLAARRRWRTDAAGCWVISSREQRVGLAARRHQRYQGSAESGIASAPRAKGAPWRLGTDPDLVRRACASLRRPHARSVTGVTAAQRSPASRARRGPALRAALAHTPNSSRIFRSRQPRVRPLLASSLGACVYIGP